ncbi:MAG: D-aminoacyl-tRNA deacylase, partial [Vulcanimicrobiaceae bacterium]
MRAVVQRVTQASVHVAGELVGAIERGFVVLLGVAVGDDERAADAMAQKLAGLRIFEDAAGAMNLAL